MNHNNRRPCVRLDRRGEQQHVEIAASRTRRTPFSSSQHHGSKQLLRLLLTVFATVQSIAWGFQNNNHHHQEPTQRMRGAWKSKGKSQLDLVEQLFRAKIVRTDAVFQVMERIDRGKYASRESRESLDCYKDCALSIGQGQTISAPHMHAYALEALYPALAKQKKKNIKILDVGCGSGYLTACFGRWLAPSNAPTNLLGIDHQPTNNDNDNNNNHRVFGIDVREDLVAMTTENISKEDGDLLENKTIQILCRDGWKGLPEEAPFDAIHVGAAAESLPKELANQLKVGGTLIIPIGPQNQAQVLYKIHRLRQTSAESFFCQDDFEITSLLGVRYVPLVPREELESS